MNEYQKLEKNNPGQGTYKEYEYLGELIKKHAACNLLIFSLGKDSELWLKLNKNGNTVFIEHEEKWVNYNLEKNPDLKIVIPKYNTKRKEWKELLNQPEKLLINLPSHIIDTQWDIIYIDGPQGGNDKRPGRMQSIYTASLLNYKHILAHDCDRIVESTYFKKYIGEPNNIVERIYHCEK